MFFVVPFAMGQHYIELKSKPVHLRLDSFYVSEVIDARAIKREIGSTNAGSGESEQPVYLREGISKSFKNYIDSVVTMDKTTRAIILAVEELFVSEQAYLAYEAGYAKLRVSFLVRENENYYSLYQTVTNAEGSHIDATKTHEERIRQVIYKALHEFNQQDVLQLEKKPYVFEEAVFTSPFSEIGVNDDLLYNEKNTGRFYSHLTAYGVYGMTVNSLGLAYMGYNYNSAHKWFIPFDLMVEIWNDITLNDTQLATMKSVRLSYFRLGLSGIRYLGKNFFVKFTLMMPIGREDITYMDGFQQKDVVTGISAMQGIWVTTKTKFGVNFGVSCFQQRLTSSIYPWNFGLQINAGFTF